VRRISLRLPRIAADSGLGCCERRIRDERHIKAKTESL
jgi:hypothetical protein